MLHLLLSLVGLEQFLGLWFFAKQRGRSRPSLQLYVRQHRLGGRFKVLLVSLQEWLRCKRNTFSCRHSWRRRSSSSWRASNWSGGKDEVTKHELPYTDIWESNIDNLYWNLSVKLNYTIFWDSPKQLVIACCHRLRWNHQSMGLIGTFRASSLWFLLG